MTDYRTCAHLDDPKKHPECLSCRQLAGSPMTDHERAQLEAQDTVIVDVELLRCSDCDPSFGCWNGQGSCSKQRRVAPDDPTPIPRTRTGQLREEVMKHNRMAVAAGIAKRVAEDARDRAEAELKLVRKLQALAEDDVARLDGEVTALWVSLGELLAIIAETGGHMTHAHQLALRRARDLHGQFKAVDTSEPPKQG